MPGKTHVLPSIPEKAGAPWSLTRGQVQAKRKKYKPRLVKSMNLLTRRHGKVWKQKLPSERISVISWRRKSQHVIRGKKIWFRYNPNLSRWHDNEVIPPQVSCCHLSEFWRNLPRVVPQGDSREEPPPSFPKWMLTGCEGNPKRHRQLQTTAWISQNPTASWTSPAGLPRTLPRLNRSFSALLSQTRNPTPRLPISVIGIRLLARYQNHTWHSTHQISHKALLILRL